MTAQPYEYIIPQSFFFFTPLNQITYVGEPSPNVFNVRGRKQSIKEGDTKGKETGGKKNLISFYELIRASVSGIGESSRRARPAGVGE